MSVIVYRDGVMAADSAAFMGGLIVSFDVQKIHRTPAGHLVGCAGKTPDIDRFLAWAMDGFPDAGRPKGIREFGALVVAPDGSITKYDERCWSYGSDGAWAVEGCEGDFLVGVLATGASAEETVRLAIRHCAYAAGFVRTMKLCPDDLGAADGEAAGPSSTTGPADRPGTTP